MKAYVLHEETERLRPLVGNLIRTILERGGSDESVPSSVLSENGELGPSLRIILLGMEVLNDYVQTADYTGALSSKTLHAYHLVERTISGQPAGAGRLSSSGSVGPEIGEAPRDV